MSMSRVLRTAVTSVMVLLTACSGGGLVKQVVRSQQLP